MCIRDRRRTDESKPPEKAIPTGKVFKEAHYYIDPAAFAKVQFKIVLKTTSSSIIPEVKDLRAICST